MQFEKGAKGVSYALKYFWIPVLLRQGIETDPNLGGGEILLG
jgi:hypothetical protein